MTKYPMTNSRITSPCGLAILSAAFLTVSFITGCKGDQSFSLNKVMKRLKSPTPEEQVAMAFDPDDADRRREGVALLSGNSWGLKEPYLAGYAELLEADEDELVRSAAARALGKAGDAKYLANLLAALSDGSDVVRWDAAVALDTVTGAAAVGPLQERALDDDSADVRSACAKAMRHYRKSGVVKTLAQCLADDSFAMRHQAHASLVDITGRDLGRRPEDWSDFAKADPPPRPVVTSKPWWDWFGVTRKKTSAGAKDVAKNGGGGGP